MDAVETGVDWLTTTWIEDACANVEVKRCAERIYGQVGVGGTPMENWASLGYVGHQIGKIKWGRREDGSIVVVSGATAHEYVKLEGPIGQNVSRLDLQITFSAPTDPSLYIKELKEQATVSRETVGGRWKISHIDGCGSGDTLYLGSRKSTIFFRIYDKGRESGDEQYAGQVRFEIEYHGERARNTLDRIRSSSSHERTILEAILGDFGSRGLYPPSHIMAVGAPTRSPSRPCQPTELKLEWLRKQIKPTVRLLLSSVPRDIIEEALGLSDNE